MRSELYLNTQELRVDKEEKDTEYINLESVQTYPFEQYIFDTILDLIRPLQKDWMIKQKKTIVQDSTIVRDPKDLEIYYCHLSKKRRYPRIL